MNTEIIFSAVCAAVIIIMIIYYYRRINRKSSVFFGVLSGMTALLILCRYGGMAGINAVFNPFNLAGSAILGVPYVIGMIIMNFL